MTTRWRAYRRGHPIATIYASDKRKAMIEASDRFGDGVALYDLPDDRSDSAEDNRLGRSEHPEPWTNASALRPGARPRYWRAGQPWPMT